jgi:CheY-like chemotaxis protein
MKVLVVDDDPGSLLVAKAAVERSGHECLTAPDGDAAWRLYQSHRPCIYRYGGEEFLLLLPDQSRYGAKTVMERSLAAVKSLNITHRRSNRRADHKCRNIRLRARPPDRQRRTPHRGRHGTLCRQDDRQEHSRRLGCKIATATAASLDFLVLLDSGSPVSACLSSHLELLLPHG